MTRLALLNIPEWTPRKLGNLLLWYDATHIAGLSDGDAVTVWKDLANAGEPFYDPFTRADSTTTLGAPWTAQTGTWGISSNKAYCVSNTTDDLATTESGLANGVVYCVINGDVDGGANESLPTVVFRFNDTDNMLWVDMYGGNIRLVKKLSGVASVLATAATTTANNTDYAIQVVYNDNAITVYKDGSSVISHTLTGGDTVFAAYTKVGMRLVKSGTPAFNATWDHFIVCKLTDAFQTTAATKPTYKVNIRNGKPVVRFSAASSQWMAIDNSALPTQDFTVLIVYNATSTTVQKALIGRAYNFGALYMSVVANNDGTNPSKLRLVVDDLNSYSTSGADGAWVIGVGRYDSAENKIYLNGANEDTDANAAGAISYNANDAATIGALRNTANATASPFDGDIAEILVSSAAFSDASRRRLENYVGKKYRTTITW